MMAKKILVTGGTGFLGEHVVSELLKRDDNEIYVLSRTRKSFSGKRIFFLEGDISNKKTLENIPLNFDVVYHIAGNIKTQKTNTPELHYSNNSVGTLNLLEFCKNKNISHLVFISSVEVYGNSLKGRISENFMKNPEDDYGKSKLLAEHCCKSFSDVFNVTVIRPSYIYGNGQPSERLFPRLIREAVDNPDINLSPVSGGNDFIYVKDAAEGIVFLEERDSLESYEEFNLSGGEFYSTKNIFDLVSKITQKSYRIKKPGLEESINSFIFDNSKINKLGYFRKYSLEEGLIDFIKEYKLSNLK